MLDLLRTRRSVRAYTDEEIKSDVIDSLQEAALRSPSSQGINPWRFFFVTDAEKLEALSESKESGSSFLKGARLGVVICADETASDVWIEDCSIASIILQLEGHSLGLGSCWIQIRNRMRSKLESAEDYVKTVLELPVELRVESIISFGYPAEEESPHADEELESDKVTNIGGEQDSEPQT